MIESHLLLAVAFASLAKIHRIRQACIVLCLLNVSLLFITLFCDKNGDTLYLLRAVASTICALVLCVPRTVIGFYQATIQLLILCSYAALAYDVSQQESIIIYNNYEMVIYGLVACQFVGIFGALSDFNHRSFKRCLRRNIYLQRN